MGKAQLRQLIREVISNEIDNNLQEGMTLNFSNKETGLPYNLDFSEVPMFKSGISVLYDAMVKVHNRIGDSPNQNRELKQQFNHLLKMAMGYTGGTAGVDKFIDLRVAKRLETIIQNLATSRKDGKMDSKMFRKLVLDNIERFARG